MGCEVFFSYARADQAHARDIAEQAQAGGFSVWWDHALLPGEEFSDVIEQALDAASAVIVLWSDASRASHWVRDEAAVGRDRNRLVPIVLSGTPPLGFRQVHTLNFSALNSDGEMRQALFDTLERLCGPREPARSKEAETAAPIGYDPVRQGGERTAAPPSPPKPAPNVKPLRQVLAEEARQRSFLRSFWATSLALCVLIALMLTALDTVLQLYTERGFNPGLPDRGSFWWMMKEYLLREGGLVRFAFYGASLAVGRFFIVIGRRLSKRKSTRYFDTPTLSAIGLSVAFGVANAAREYMFLHRFEGQEGFWYINTPSLYVQTALTSAFMVFPVFAAISILIGYFGGRDRQAFEEGK